MYKLLAPLYCETRPTGYYRVNGLKPDEVSKKTGLIFTTGVGLHNWQIKHNQQVMWLTTLPVGIHIKIVSIALSQKIVTFSIPKAYNPGWIRLNCLTRIDTFNTIALEEI